ncbi:hypothetical protein [Paracoccus onubensis]|uniref:Sulfotransferase family protein n=1 Tax=Paracoccus onubensis TaxID=1675788 RepID=A0A418SSB3_9RHOB|nr:hypothetical protein [Paracoccus onubensis]RJE83767.1 hypothetical protein D3P04_15340 [Paracoccus onubensis]
MTKLRKATGPVTGKRRLIVHCGVQKTGSTSIQRYLMQNADLLANDLIVRTPTEGSPMRPLGRAAIDFSFHPDSSDSRQTLKIALDDVLETLPADSRPVLLSHENLAGAMPGNGGETRLFPALPSILAIVKEHATEFDVDFVYYTRRMSAWKPSVWAQAVRTDGYTRTEKEFMAETADLPGWKDLSVRLIESVGADCLSRFKLEDESDPLRLGLQLLHHAGLSDDRLNALQPLHAPSMSRLNESATEFIRHINMLNINPHARRKVINLIANEQHLFNSDHRSEGTL